MLKRSLSSLALAAFVMSLLPGTLLAAPDPCIIKALDTVAGLGTQVTIQGCAKETSMEFTLTGPSGSVYSQTVTTDGNGNATTLVPSKVTVTAGIYTVTLGERKTDFTVIADRPDDTHSILSASPKSVKAGGVETVTVTTVLLDRYDNPVSGRPLGLISNRSSDDISPQMHETDDDGAFIWTVRPAESGTMTLIPYDIMSGKQMKLRTEVIVGSNAAFRAAAAGTKHVASTYRAALTGFEQGGDTEDFSPALVDHFELSLPDGATEVTSNELFSVTIRAMQGTEIVRSYIGALIVEAPDDPDAELPKKGEDPRSPSTGRIDIRNVDQGERKVPLSFLFKKRGEQTIIVYDKLDPDIRGSLTLTVDGSGHAASDDIVILDPKDRSSVKGTTVLLQGRAPSLINLLVRTATGIVYGESDSEGVFRIEIPLNPSDKQVTYFVESENGTYESAPVTAFIDNEAPVIDTADIVPAEGRTGEKARITVKSESALKSVLVNVDGKDTILTATGTNLYVGDITAPEKPGTFDVKIEARDVVENVGSLLLKWNVAPKSVPVVEGVAAESLAGQVKLKWNAVGGYPIAEYKVYVAKQSEPENFLYALGTQKPVTSAVITGLPLGISYLFSLTALGTDGAESPKSNAVLGTPLGIALKAVPGKQHVVLEWNAPANLPLARYILEYGTEPSQYTEKRTVSGQAKTMIVRDLIGDLHYEFRLTPVAVTGKVLTEMAAVVSAVPMDGSFVMGSDPVPDGFLDSLHSGAPPLETYKPSLKHVPAVTGSGISSITLVLALLGAAIIGMYVRSMRRERRLVGEFMRSMRERYDA